ncbi:MAG: hypothetical protein ACN4GZ_15825 [Acidimicrobiales bacterium]
MPSQPHSRDREEPVPIEQSDQWITVQWGASDNELLVTAQPNPGFAPTSVWLVTAEES